MPTQSNRPDLQWLAVETDSLLIKFDDIRGSKMLGFSEASFKYLDLKKALWPFFYNEMNDTWHVRATRSCAFSANHCQTTVGVSSLEGVPKRNSGFMILKSLSRSEATDPETV